MKTANVAFYGDLIQCSHWLSNALHIAITPTFFYFTLCCPK